MKILRRERKWASSIVAGALFASTVLMPAQACTGIRLTAADGSVVPARTMEFAIDPHSDIMISPRGFERVGTTPDGKPGKAWKAKYASVGANGLGLKVLVDGFNEKGLAAELFYFPGTAGYMPYSPADAGNTMAPWNLGSWLLDNFASVDEVKANIGKVVVLQWSAQRLEPRTRGALRRPRRHRKEHGDRIHQGQARYLRQPARRVHELASLRLADDESAQLPQLLDVERAAVDARQVGHADGGRARIRPAGNAWRLHPAVAVRSGGCVQSFRVLPSAIRGRMPCCRPSTC